MIFVTEAFSSGRRRNCPGFSYVEVIVVLSIIVILAVLILPRIADFRRDTAGARNAANLQQVAAALEHFTLDGHSLTNADSTEIIVAQLARLNYITPSAALTSVQILSVYTNGFIFFASTYDN